jgi:protein TonB
MSNRVIFKELPATFPEKDKYKKPSIAVSVSFHVILIVAVILIPLLVPHRIEEWELLTTLVSPVGPPPPPPPTPVEVAVLAKPAMPEPEVMTKVKPDAVIMPTAIPKEIARIIEEPIVPTSGVIGGVQGGMPSGAVSGLLAGILSNNPKPPEVAPPPPPPPPPAPVPAPLRTSPVRVGGLVQEPKIVNLVPPVYPPLASRARVTGTVILEAILTAEGTVDEIRVISGHPLLNEAAIDCVKQWRYEPTYLNSVPVPVILTAKVTFHSRPIS